MSTKRVNTAQHRLVIRTKVITIGLTSTEAWLVSLAIVGVFLLLAWLGA